MGANKPSGTRVVGAIRHQDAATYLRWMQIDVRDSTGTIPRQIGWRATMNCNSNIVKSKMASSPYPAAEDDRAFLTKKGLGRSSSSMPHNGFNCISESSLVKKGGLHVAEVARCTEGSICDSRVLTRW